MKTDWNTVRCHHTGFKRRCADIRNNPKGGCPKWVHLIGNDPNTGNPVDEFACSDHWLPIMLCEISQKTNQVGAAVESFRNESVRGESRIVQGMREAVAISRALSPFPDERKLKLVSDGESENHS